MFFCPYMMHESRRTTWCGHEYCMLCVWVKSAQCWRERNRLLVTLSYRSVCWLVGWLSSVFAVSCMLNEAWCRVWRRGRRLLACCWKLLEAIVVKVRGFGNNGFQGAWRCCRIVTEKLFDRCQNRGRREKNRIHPKRKNMFFCFEFDSLKRRLKLVSYLLIKCDTTARRWFASHNLELNSWLA